MRKIEFRAIICLALAGFLFLGLVILVGKFVIHGPEWATFYANRHIYANGHLAVGNIYDINGNILEENNKGEITFNDDYWTRRGTVHAVGDRRGNIATSAEVAFKSDIVGYNLLTGTYSVTGRGKDIKLTIDANVSRAAAEALGERNGVVGVYNYNTGEILCMVSGPNFDPLDPPEVSSDDDSGLYLNKFLSGKMIPGSIFKLVTSAAAIENIGDIHDFHYYCPGVLDIEGEKITCTEAHGDVDFHQALIKSCNGAFAKITQKIGPGIMTEYVNRLGLTNSYDMSGIKNVKGSFDFPKDAAFNLAWAGIGQWNDEINPLSMLVYVGAIANGGKAPEPRIIHNDLRPVSMTKQLIEEETSKEITEMMKGAVEETYGEYNFPDLEIYAKSGTAEVHGRRPNAWFTGFIKNPDQPYAFIICVENGGYGSQIAGPIANDVLQAVISR